MKTAIYIEDGVVQLVVTPESEFEMNALSSFENKELYALVFSGSFYDCRGGWTRQQDYYPRNGLMDGSKDRSLIVRVGTKEEPNEATGRDQ